MLRLGRYTFKRAETSAELDQVHRLNYETFVREIPQHTDDCTGRLIDKFHTKNTYLLALREDQLVGMVSVHDEPPFSIADRLPDPKILQEPGMRPLEVRLLAVAPDERHGPVPAGLVWLVWQFAKDNGHTHLFISGVTGQRQLYEHLGFEPLGPAVGRPEARFLPMMVTMERLFERMSRAMSLWEKRLRRNGAAALPAAEPLSLLPGPVPIAAAVTEAFHRPPIYHRSAEFIERFEGVRRSLAALTGSKSAAVLVGSGTLSNEVVAATISRAPGADNGLLLVNGEFSRRLLRQAQRFGLYPSVREWPWGKPWDLSVVADAMDRMRPGGWVWGVHLESSTGVLNDLPGLIQIASARGIRVCADCVSSLASVPVDLSQVYLATGATGKAFASYAGLALIFADPERLSDIDADRVPTYLDLRATLASYGPRHTVPSPLVLALEAALKRYANPESARARFETYADMGRLVRTRLRELGLPPMAEECCSCPVLTTFNPPAGDSVSEFVVRCEGWGFLIGGQSQYLAERNLVQIANMGEVTRTDLERFFDRLADWLSHRQRAAAAR